VLGALEVGQRAEFDRILSGLSGEETVQLRALDSPLAGARPLLHLMAGGHSEDALLTLASSPRASEELLEMGGGGDLGVVLATTNEVIRRAALGWLAGARETLEARAQDAEFCSTVDAVAASLGLNEVRHASRELWLELEPSAAAHHNVAHALLWVVDFAAADGAYT
jgi:hypothetical protein